MGFFPSASGGSGSGTKTSTEEVVAYSGGGQADATPLSQFYCLVTVENDMDSVKMLAATTNTTQKIENTSTVNTLAIYPQSGEQFFGYAIDDPYLLAPGGIRQFTCFVAGTFY